MVSCSSVRHRCFLCPTSPRSDHDQQGIIYHAIMSINSKLKHCLKFVRRDPSVHTDYVYIHSPEPESMKCSTFAGRQEGVNHVDLNAPDCITHEMVLHELFHKLGLYHEHTRLDRDVHVFINSDEIRPGESLPS